MDNSPKNHVAQKYMSPKRQVAQNETRPKYQSPSCQVGHQTTRPNCTHSPKWYRETTRPKFTYSPKQTGMVLTDISDTRLSFLYWPMRCYTNIRVRDRRFESPTLSRDTTDLHWPLNNFVSDRWLSFLYQPISVVHQHYSHQHNMVARDFIGHSLATTCSNITSRGE